MIVLTPDSASENGLEAILHGELAVILNVASMAGQKQKLSRTDVLESQLSVVAGTRYRRSHYSIVAI